MRRCISCHGNGRRQRTRYVDGEHQTVAMLPNLLIICSIHVRLYLLDSREGKYNSLGNSHQVDVDILLIYILFFKGVGK